MPISRLCERPHIHLPGLWIQTGTRHWTPWCGLLVPHSADRQASDFILLEQTPGHTAACYCNCLIEKASIDLWGEGRLNLQSPPNSPGFFLQETNFKIPKRFHSEAMSPNLSSVQKVFCSPPECDILWQVARLGTELEVTELIGTTGVRGTRSIISPEHINWVIFFCISVILWKFSAQKEILWKRIFRFKGNLGLKR